MSRKQKKRDQNHKPQHTPHPSVEGFPEGYVWNAERDGPLPDVWRRKPAPVPCHRCHARQDYYASQAVVCYGRKPATDEEEEGVYLHCRVCGFKFTLPVAE